MIGQVGRPASLTELWPMLDDGLSPMAGGTDLLALAKACGMYEGDLV